MNSNKRLKKLKKLDSNSFNSKKFKEFKDFEKFLKFQKLSDLLNDEKLIELEHLKKQKEILIPTSIFNVKLGALESICKYLKENLSLSNKKISILLQRNNKSIWKTYDSAKKKYPEKFLIVKTEQVIPVNVFSNEKMSVLENLVSYLKESFNLSYKEISVILHRNERTIWTAYNRGLKKK